MAQSTKQSTKKRAKKRKVKFKNSLTPVAIVLGILVMLMAALFLLCVLFFAPKHRSVHTQDSTPEAVTVDPDAPEAATEPGTTSPTATEPPSLPYSELAAECFGEENGFKTYRSKELTAKLGIDVSSHQGWIDWQAVLDSGIEYAMIRAGYRGYSEGDTNQDDFFQYNIEYATALGLDVGVYYFSQALTEEEAIAEAKEVLALVDGYELSYPIYFDWETVTGDEARTDTISSSEVTACALAFCQTIEEAGYEAGIYFNLSTATQLFRLTELKDYDFWLAEYRDTPSYPFEIDMWQYTDAGTVPGIEASVDLNLSFK